MSYRVEVDAVDAELLSALKKYKASGSMNWDSTIASDVTMKISIAFPLGQDVPQAAIEAINACVTACVAAYRGAQTAGESP